MVSERHQCEREELRGVIISEVAERWRVGRKSPFIDGWAARLEGDLTDRHQRETYAAHVQRIVEAERPEGEQEMSDKPSLLGKELLAALKPFGRCEVQGISFTPDSLHSVASFIDGPSPLDYERARIVIAKAEALDLERYWGRQVDLLAPDCIQKLD